MWACVLKCNTQGGQKKTRSPSTGVVCCFVGIPDLAVYGDQGQGFGAG